MREDREDFLQGSRTECRMPRDGRIQSGDVSFSCFKVKCYLEGCIEVMVFGEKFLLNVGAEKAADKAVAKGLREIFPKLTSSS